MDAGNNIFTYLNSYMLIYTYVLRSRMTSSFNQFNVAGIDKVKSYTRFTLSILIVHLITISFRIHCILKMIPFEVFHHGRAGSDTTNNSVLLKKSVSIN